MVPFFLFLLLESCLSAAIDREKEVAMAIEGWNPESGSNVWELSGLFEGDIELPLRKNGNINPRTRWPLGVVPYIIGANFTEQETANIKKAIDEFNRRTCLRFRPKEKDDKNYIRFVNRPGCSSIIGMVGGEQSIRLQSPLCLNQVGTIVHEILHTLGFYHQHSAANRDEYVKVVWENIRNDSLDNFNKFSTSVITDFGLPYDYNSILHYSSMAFTRNGKPTLVPLDKSAKIGQRKEFSEIDVAKVDLMYRKLCEAREERTGRVQDEGFLGASLGFNHLIGFFKIFFD